MVSLSDFVAFLDRELKVANVVGDEPNGLLVRGSEDVRKVGLAANATFEVIREGLRRGTRLLLTHHGGWKRIDLHLADVKERLLREHDASLYVAHACLDNSDTYGTSTTLARMLGLGVQHRFADYRGGKAGVYGEIVDQSFPAFLDSVSRIPGAAVSGWRNRESPVRRVAIVTGAGYLTKWVDEAASLGCDTYLTGEGSMFTTIFAKEAEINLVFAGHTATERPGVLHLGEVLTGAFQGLDVVEIPETYF